MITCTFSASTVWLAVCFFVFFWRRICAPDGKRLEATQDWPAAHATPQEPQLEALVFNATSQPSAGLRLQLANPTLHAIWQAPAAQEGVPFVLLQMLPQVPQLFLSVDTVVSQPLLAFPSQFPNPELHEATWQAPA